MAEPNTPGTPAPPDGPDHVLAGLGLDGLAEGVHPDAGQWSGIVTAAAHRRNRRTWFAAVAALVLLVAGGLAVAVGSRDDTDGVAVATGGTDDLTHVLPPEGATVAAGWVIEGSYGLVYSDPETGRTLILRRYDLDALAEDGAPLPAGQRPEGSPAVSVDAAPFGAVRLGCASEWWTGNGTAMTLVAARGPLTTSWDVGRFRFALQAEEGAEEPCTPSADLEAQAVAETSRLRWVDEAQWQSYVRDLGDLVEVTEPEEAPSTSTVLDPQPPSTTTTSVPGVAPPTEEAEDPPADPGSAEEQIAAAVAGWSVQDADGSFPNLEDGTEKAAEYAAAFATAGRQSGADQVDDDSGDRTRLLRLRFVTPERASITMELTAKLPSGTFTFGQEGEAILRDGRWVVTYRTVVTTLGRACLPPGGYDGCPPGS